MQLERKKNELGWYRRTFADISCLWATYFRKADMSIALQIEVPKHFCPLISELACIF
jgi:hypothetical protein